MITILIVDDEKNIRAGIHKILSESISYEIRFIEARNGLEALEIVDSDSPELMITDIRMPKMDGVELMQRLSSRATRPDIIVLSGFDDFGYAKEAIRYGAVSYILKPVDRVELISVVTTAITAIERNKKSSIERTIARVMSEGRMVRSAKQPKAFIEAPFYFVMITGKVSPEHARQILDKSSCYLLEKKNDSLCVLVRDAEFPAIEGGYVAISGVCKSLANIRSAWRQALIASYCRFFDQGVRVIRYLEPTEAFDRSEFDARAQKLITMIGSGEQADIERGVRDLFNVGAMPLEAKARYVYFLHDFIVTVLVKRYWEYMDTDMYLGLKGLMLENIHQFDSIQDYERTVVDYAVYLNGLLKKNNTEYPFVAEAIEYIRAHYTEEINMTVVANHVSVNYTYFSEKFKEHTGVNFNDYLKKLRIEEAKRLLEKGCFKVYEVSANSGFGDVKYFMKTFKESTGLSPGEYRKKF